MQSEILDLQIILDQPVENVRNTLLNALQRLVEHMRAGNPPKMPDPRSHLIIDAQRERGQRIAHLLSSSGHRPVVMGSALEAFTRFLRVPFVPFSLILCDEDGQNTLFLQRLIQQVAVRYDWQLPQIRLRFTNIQTGAHTLNLSSSQPTTPSPPAPFQSPTKPFPNQQRTTGNLQPITRPPQLSGTESRLPPGLTPLNQRPQPAQPARTPGIRPLLASYHEEQPVVAASPSLPRSGPLSGSRPGETPHRPVSLDGLDIGRYHILEHLGGGKGNVYKAYDRLRENDVALKALPVDALPYYLMEQQSSEEEENIYQRESELLRDVEHPGIVPVWNHGKSYISGSPFVYKTMPLCEGSLLTWLQQRSASTRAFSPWDVGHILIQLAEALQYLHDEQKTFQNFKVSNILIRNQNDSMGQLEVALGDLALPQDGSYMPKAIEAYAYMAPERWHGHASPATDQYGLAVLAYELLVGRAPFQGNTDRVMKLLHANMQPQPPSTFNPALPASVNHVLLRALSKRPESRFASVIIFAKTYQMSCL